MEIKTILTPNLESLVEQVYFAAKSGWTLIPNDPASMFGFQYELRMQRPENYKEQNGEESLSHVERMAKARETLKINRALAKEAGLSYKEFMASKGEAVDDDEN